jgi:predicted AAA+ superfamily ATPase
MEAMQQYGLKEGLILTEDEENSYYIDDFSITVKPVWKWLLEAG